MNKQEICENLNLNDHDYAAIDWWWIVLYTFRSERIENYSKEVENKSECGEVIDYVRRYDASAPTSSASIQIALAMGREKIQIILCSVLSLSFSNSPYILIFLRKPSHSHRFVRSWMNKWICVRGEQIRLNENASNTRQHLHHYNKLKEHPILR